MKTFATIILSILASISYSQETATGFDGHKWEAPYALPAPQGWGIERFLIPISFAPQISYKGVEDIRFTPGWAKLNSEEYWSYAFLWYLEGDIQMSAKIIENNLRNYYSGLVSTNGRNIPKEKLMPVKTSFKNAKKEYGDVKTFSGTTRMLDYMSQKPIILNGKVHVRTCPGENKTFIFFELSPQPLSHSVWQSLDKLWLEFRCKKN